MDSDNPYSAPEAQLDPPDTELVEFRKRHLLHEGLLKSLGIVYLFIGIWLSLLGFIASLTTRYEPEAILSSLLFMAFGIVMIITSFSIRKLKPWSRLTIAFISIPGLFLFPIGSILCIACLILIFSPKGIKVFSKSYKEIIEQTPQVTTKIPLIFWCLSGLFFVGMPLAMMILGLFYARH